MRGLDRKAAPVGALLVLCLLWASASLRSELFPGSAAPAASSPLRSQAILLSLFALGSAAMALVRREQWPSGRTLRLSAAAGIGLFVVPAVLIAVAKDSIDDSTRLVLFSLVPIFAVVLNPHLGTSSSVQQRGSLAASLVAVTGTLFVFPLELPQTIATAFAFAGILAATASVAAANCVAARIASEPPAPSMLSFATVVTGSSALVLGALGALTEHHLPSATLVDPWLALDLLALALLFWLMRRMTAVRMTTRFIIAPLLANLIGLAFLRPGVQTRGWLGLTLIAMGSGWLLLAPEDEPERTGSSLSIHQP